MSLKAAIQAVVHLGKFRNIDLLNQGFYQIELSFSSKHKSKVKSASLLAFETLDSLSDSTLDFNPHRVREGNLEYSTNKAQSRVFLIRYADEEVRLNEVLSFLIEIPINSTPIQIQIDLLYSSQKNGPHSLSVVASRNFIISSPLQGAQEYFPVSFESPWLAHIQAILHIVFLSYHGKSSQSLAFQSVFSNKKAVPKQLIDQIYKDYVQVLGDTYNSLRYCAKVLEDTTLPKLVLPLNTNPDVEFIETFSEIINTDHPAIVSDLLLKEINLVSNKIQSAFSALRALISRSPDDAFSMLLQKYRSNLREVYKDFAVTTLLHPSDYNLIFSSKMKKAHKKTSKLIRKTSTRSSVTTRVVDRQSHPVIFEERYPYNLEIRQNSSHIIVLVHGLGGSPQDLTAYKQIINSFYPSTIILSSNYCAGRTDQTITEMGFSLSKEICAFISGNRSSPLLSFIAHSLGGLVVRSALNYLECVSDRMHSYISLSTPHLGLLYPTKMIDTGLKFMKKAKKVPVMKELLFNDSEFKEGTSVYRLSMGQGLNWFKHVVLVNSTQDDYVPSDSARIEVPTKAADDSSNGSFYIKMVHNIMSSLDLQKIRKIDVNFKLKTSLQAMIGRSAHIQLAENQGFAKMIACLYEELFVA